jgi:hypothetical protein
VRRVHFGGEFLLTRAYSNRDDVLKQRTAHHEYIGSTKAYAIGSLYSAKKDESRESAALHLSMCRW